MPRSVSWSRRSAEKKIRKGKMIRKRKGRKEGRRGHVHALRDVRHTASVTTGMIHNVWLKLNNLISSSGSVITIEDNSQPPSRSREKSRSSSRSSPLKSRTEMQFYVAPKKQHMPTQSRNMPTHQEIKKLDKLRTGF